MRGHAMPELGTALSGVTESSTDDGTRNDALKEIVLARALVKCGDNHGIGREILEQYAQDQRGGFSVHAKAVLATA